MLAYCLQNQSWCTDTVWLPTKRGFVITANEVLESDDELSNAPTSHMRRMTKIPTIQHFNQHIDIKVRCHAKSLTSANTRVFLPILRVPTRSWLYFTHTNLCQNWYNLCRDLLECASQNTCYYILHWKIAKLYSLKYSSTHKYINVQPF